MLCRGNSIANIGSSSMENISQNVLSVKVSKSLDDDELLE